MTAPPALEPIAWYRPSPFGKIIKHSIYCGVCMMIGVITVGFGLDLSGRVQSSWQPILFLIGIATIITSITLAFWGYFKILSNDTTTLILEKKGVRMQKEKSDNFIPWVKIESIESKDRIIRLKTENECFEIHDTFLGISNQNLADEIREMQRKVLLGVI
ncbi:MAG: hypothetical protein VX278_18370 [Myxococcota bacterium]|nr:hypothetical protein [Myxococcota bacterium]